MSDDPILYVQKDPATLREVTGPEAQERLNRSDVILIPVGATEDHGAHLPLGTDSMEACEICRRTTMHLADQDGPVVTGPAIPFGTSSFHLDFSGTVSISSSTLIALLKEVCLIFYSPEHSMTGDKGYAAIVDWLSMAIIRDFFDERRARCAP